MALLQGSNTSKAHQAAPSCASCKHKATNRCDASVLVVFQGRAQPSVDSMILSGTSTQCFRLDRPEVGNDSEQCFGMMSYMLKHGRTTHKEPHPTMFRTPLLVSCANIRRGQSSHGRPAHQAPRPHRGTKRQGSGNGIACMTSCSDNRNYPLCLSHVQTLGMSNVLRAMRDVSNILGAI